jgi:hypothetical protein
MGFFDKVKALKNMVTGGAAEVKISAENFCIGTPFNVEITVKTDDAPVKIDRGYLYVRGIREYPVIEIRRTETPEGIFEEEYETTDYDETYDFDFDFIPEQELPANKTLNYSVEVLIPEGSMDIFDNGAERHYYKFLAGLDTFGNDPDSGWKIVD